MKSFCREILARSDVVILDTETTCLDDRAEVLQLGVIGLDGAVLFDRLIAPSLAAAWPEAERVHGISPQDVVFAPTFGEFSGMLTSCLVGKTITVFNAPYDRRLIQQSIEYSGSGAWFKWLDDCEWIDVMVPYAEFYGQWNEYHKSYTWQSLTNACRQQGIVVEDAHDAIGDCKMTLALLRKIASS